MSLKYAPSSEPLHMFAKWFFLNWEGFGEVEGGGCGEGEQHQHPCRACGVWSLVTTGAFPTGPPLYAKKRSYPHTGSAFIYPTLIPPRCSVNTALGPDGGGEEGVGEVEGGGCGEGEQDQHPCSACGVWSLGSPSTHFSYPFALQFLP